MGGFVATLLAWAVVLVRGDAQEVGTSLAILEGLAIGGAIAVPGVALFLLVRVGLRSGRLWRGRAW